MSKGRTRYMHTLDGLPAYYEAGRQIVFASKEVKSLAVSLRQIRAEVKASAEWRAKHGFTAEFDHGYKRVRV